MLALFRDYDVMWPTATSTALGWFEILNAGFSMFAPECFFGGGSFYVVYIFQMVLPFVCVGTCVTAYYGAELALRRLDPRRERRVDGAATGGVVGWLEGLKIRCWKNAFWFVTLLYPRCAMTALQLFGWKKLDVGTFLKADFSIMVKYPGGAFVATYLKYMIPGIPLLILYAAVIPAFWFAAVYLNRGKLDDAVVQAKYGFLYSSYSCRFPYWETTEMLRKFAIAFMPVFIPTQANGSLQAAAGQVVLLVYIMLTLRCWPFAAHVDNWLQLASLTVLWLLLLTAGVSKWEDLDGGGATALGVVQLTLSSGVGFLLACAIFFNGLHLARQLSRNWSQKRRDRRASRQAATAEAAAEVSEDGGEDGGEAGGDGGGTPGRSVAAKLSAARASLGLACLPCVAGSKRGTMEPLTSDDGEIAAAAAAADGGKAARDSRAGLPTINVHAGPRDEEAGAGPLRGAFGGDTPQSRRDLAGPHSIPLKPCCDSRPLCRAAACPPTTAQRKLLRTSSSMSRRSAADDAEMRLPMEGVQRSDSSTLPAWPGLPPLAEGAPLPSPRRGPQPAPPVQQRPELQPQLAEAAEAAAGAQQQAQGPANAAEEAQGPDQQWEAGQPSSHPSA
ncbi:hypothetical protein CHLNCDRAFT_133816 [Chlorella variabilis]|uniref:TRP C-terminal domain-containing protein n=1 Tax=Chlorella variabilis TaxID=554065 RepID=E1ZFA7_CHLVA|nr:hypothetical protein CHLNCDRAFT_133816 [Chlorella variabilis]EFN55637.1 hypothetical protein CHLNCDRAFT_133816 [Chlorella variabilis]|eukprot:XP_005847739.1 hypothetical protein CHLNCDRAFT_133816 [Chlorella variabilis]